MATPKVTLLTSTQDPLETVWSVWDSSKTTGPLRPTSWVKKNVNRDELTKLFRAVIAQRIPVGEHVDFCFIIENVSVSWREQAVRHRIGTKPSPERLGADIVMVDKIPDLAESTWWSQSMRIQDMSEFATTEMYRLPESLAGKQVLVDSEDGGAAFYIPAEALFKDTMEQIESAYKKLVKAGVPMEDARELMPLGAQHRISWKLNMAALQHIVGERGCSILQLGIWGPVIEGMISELVEKVDPIFAELVTPPCIKKEEFKGCIYLEENRRRITGDDALPVCSLYATQHQDILVQINPGPIRMEKEMRERAEQYRRFWNRDPYTGKRL